VDQEEDATPKMRAVSTLNTTELSSSINEVQEIRLLSLVWKTTLLLT
jgi:hypothetical protein